MRSASLVATATATAASAVALGTALGTAQGLVVSPSVALCRSSVLPAAGLTSVQARRASGGFGRTSSGGGGMGKQRGKGGRTTRKPSLPTYELDRGPSIEDYLNPGLLGDATKVEEIRERIRGGNICVIRDAFLPEFAEAMHSELDGTDAWSVNEDYFADGYGYRHNNVYSTEDFSPLFLRANEMFDSAETKAFMSDLTGRDCSGESVGAPSYYEPGHHSLPHTDHIGQRSVAYIWHLSKNWRPEYGGGLYWAQEPLANAYLHASFNSLVLFSVTPHSSHFVTTVSPRAKGKRLAYNGWWHSSWVPTASDPLEELLATPQQRLGLTHAQVLAVQDLLDDPWAPRIQPPERDVEVRRIRDRIMAELYPQEKSPPIAVGSEPERKGG